VRWGLLFWFALVAVLSHILLDFTNNYGVRPFEPFSYRWYHWDIVFIFEPVMWVVLLGGLVLPALFRLVQEEIGAHTQPGRAGAITALVLIALLWGLRDYQHRHAVAALEALDYHGEAPRRVSAYPYPIDPFIWSGVVETQDFYEVANVNSLSPEVDPDRQGFVRYKPEQTPAVLAAERSRLGRVYLDWAAYPYVQSQPVMNGEVVGGFTVTFRDMRFTYPGRSRLTLGATVSLDRNLRVIAEYTGPRPKPSD
jgi:inner membrane protein